MEEKRQLMSDNAAATGRQPTNHIELCRRPLRRAVKGATNDTAGAAGGDKGPKVFRLRGKGNPPPSDKEWEFHPSKHFIPGKSFESSISKVLNQQAGPPPDGANDGRWARPSVRPSTRSYETHLAGSAAAVTIEEEVVKQKRRPATAGPRTERVLGIDNDGSESAQPTYALLGTARRDVFVTSQRQAAPACVLLTKTQTRAGYNVGRSAYGDVLQYRHSGGICPSDYKLVSERPAAPQLATPASQDARSSFFDSRSSYTLNRMRSHMSNVIIGH